MGSSNFNFLQHHQAELAALCVSAEGYVYTDPQSAFVKLRCFSELYAGFIYEELNLPTYGAKNFFERLDNNAFKKAVERCVLDKLHFIRMKGNKAAHPAGVDTSEALRAVKEAYFLSAWLYMTFHGGQLEDLPEYTEPKPVVAASDQLKKDLDAVHQQLSAQSAELEQARQELADVQKQQVEVQKRLASKDIEVNQARLQQVQEASSQAVSRFDFEEESTRKAIRMADVFAEYELTEGQGKLVEQLEGFLSGQDHGVFLLKGYAGTGKTFITRGLTQYFKSIGRNFVLAAPTGKASKVIASKTQCEAYTLHKTIYSFKDIKEYTDDALNGSETYKFYADLGVNELSVDTVYIVDESSMISDIYNESEFFRCGSGFLLRDFLKFVNLDHNDHRKKVIFIGDDAQLPPVGMNTSPALDPAYLLKEYGLATDGYELTEVVRQKADSGVMHNAIAMRQSLKTGVFNQLDFNLDFPDVAHVDYPELIDQYLESCNRKINAESIVIAHSNADVAAYNRRIRAEFFPGELKVCAGDKVMASTNSEAHGFFICNGDFGQVRKVLADTETRIIKIKRRSEESGKVETIEVPLLFRHLELAFRDLEGRAHAFNAYVIENLLYSDKATLSSDENKALYLDFCIRHPGLVRNSLEFKEALRSDPYFNALRLKFGYAITCHKAQGSEWNHVFVKCKTHQNQLCADYFRWLYTAITRTSSRLYVLEEPHIKLGSGIKVVGSPGVAMDAAPSQISHKIEPESDMGSTLAAPLMRSYDAQFGIPSDNTFLLALLEQVKTCVSSVGASIYDVKHQNYQEAYLFSRGSDSARVNISYNGKQKVTSVVLTQPSELADELLTVLSPLRGRVITAPVDTEASDIQFDEDFLNEFYQRLKATASEADIGISNVESKQFLQRYWFHQSGETAVIDIYYNKKKRFTNCVPNTNMSSCPALLSKAVALITEGMA